MFFKEKIKVDYGCPLCNPNNNNRNKKYEKDYYETVPFDSTIINTANIKTVLKTKSGTISFCTICHRKWFIKTSKIYNNMYHIDEIQQTFIEKWDSAKNTWEQNPILRQSPVIKAYEHFQEKKYIQLGRTPCCAILKDGSRFEMALIIEDSEPNFRFLKPKQLRINLDEVRELRFSDYALNPEVMGVQYNATEAAMGFNPVTLSDSNGNLYTIKAPKYFFKEDGILGKDMKYCGKDYWRNSPNICDCDYEELIEIYVFYDYSME